MSSTASELTVKLDSSEEDVFLVTYERPDGSVFRGALLKIKQWLVSSLFQHLLPNRFELQIAFCYFLLYQLADISMFRLIH
jgi:hypothetical protein